MKLLRLLLLCLSSPLHFAFFDSQKERLVSCLIELPCCSRRNTFYCWLPPLLLVCSPDRDDPTKLHAYFSGCQGRHADIHSTLPGERFAAMRDKWVSYGAWGYSNIEVNHEK